MKKLEFKDIEYIMFTDKEGRKCNIYTVDKAIITTCFETKYCKCKVPKNFIFRKKVEHDIPYSSVKNQNIDLYLKKDGLFNGKFVDMSEGSMIIVTKDEVVKLYNINNLNESNGVANYTSSAGEDGYFYYISNRDFNKYPSRCLLNIPTAKDAFEKSMKSKVDYLDYSVKNGFMTINEARRKLNLQSITGGDILISKLSITDEDIQIDRVSRIDHILDSTKDGCDAIDGCIEVIKVLDNKLPGKEYLYELKFCDESMIYSDTFVEDMLKKEFIKHLESEDKKIDKYKYINDYTQI